jgi:hypothetical protein
LKKGINRPVAKRFFRAYYCFDKIVGHRRIGYFNICRYIIVPVTVIRDRKMTDNGFRTRTTDNPEL